MKNIFKQLWDDEILAQEIEMEKRWEGYTLFEKKPRWYKELIFALGLIYVVIILIVLSKII